MSEHDRQIIVVDVPQHNAAEGFIRASSGLNQRGATADQKRSS